MNYKKRAVSFANPMSFFQYYASEERFLFYHPQKKELVMGAKRLKKLDAQEEIGNYPYVFSSFTFFERVKEEKWEGMGNESVAFMTYLKVQDGVQTLYSLEEEPHIPEYTALGTKHSFRMPEEDFEDWQRLFSVTKNCITEKKASKIVISREVSIEGETIFDVVSILENLLKQNSSSFVFAYTKDGKTFLGATPEILVQKEGSEIISYAIAGTADRKNLTEDPLISKILSDEKNLHEHQIVMDDIAEVMRKYTDQVLVGETHILTLKNIYHLKTQITAIDNNGSLMDWALRLHPTPALGGMPVAVARDMIRFHEKHERGLYAAPIGLLDGDGNGLYVAGIRSALIMGNIAYAYVGCGIVDKSDCEIEYEETKSKLLTILESL